MRDSKHHSCPFCSRIATRPQDLKAHFTLEHKDEIECEGKYPVELLDELPNETVPPRHRIIRPSLRRRALDRDNHECQRCFESDREVLRVHHLIPVAAGGPDHLGNVVTLCQECHDKAHGAMGELHETHPGLLDALRDVVCN